MREPIDIVIVLDNSGSMDEELDSVERNINVSFAGIVQADDAAHVDVLFTCESTIIVR